jgi:hypothetical protein
MLPANLLKNQRLICEVQESTQSIKTFLVLVLVILNEP